MPQRFCTVSHRAAAHYLSSAHRRAWNGALWTHIGLKIIFRRLSTLTGFTSRNFVTTSFRITAAVIFLTIASLVAPSAAYAKRMGSAGRTTPRVSQKAPAAPIAPKAPVAAAAPPAAATPAGTPAPAARGSGMMGTMGAAAAGAVAGTVAGSALAGGMSSDKEAKAKEAEAVTAEKEAKELQLKADEAKRKAEAVRATVK